MTIKIEEDYFEEKMDCSFCPTEPIVCKICGSIPELFSQRAHLYKGFVKLLGLKICCIQCEKCIEMPHQKSRETLHPDDATARKIINEWNKMN